MPENIPVKAYQVIAEYPECRNDDKAQVKPAAEGKRDLISELKWFDVDFAEDIK